MGNIYLLSQSNKLFITLRHPLPPPPIQSPVPVKYCSVAFSV